MPELPPTGHRHRLTFVITDKQTVPAVFADSAEFAAMPRVLATAYLVGLVERACIELLRDHLDFPTEMTLGTHIDISHSAPTTVGETVTIEVELTEQDGRTLAFKVVGRDERHEITRGTHRRALIDTHRFLRRVGLD